MFNCLHSVAHLSFPWSMHWLSSTISLFGCPAMVASSPPPPPPSPSLDAPVTLAPPAQDLLTKKRFLWEMVWNTYFSANFSWFPWFSPSSHHPVHCAENLPCLPISIPSSFFPFSFKDITIKSDMSTVVSWSSFSHCLLGLSDSSFVLLYLGPTYDCDIHSEWICLWDWLVKIPKTPLLRQNTYSTS